VRLERAGCCRALGAGVRNGCDVLEFDGFGWGAIFTAEHVQEGAELIVWQVPDSRQVIHVLGVARAVSHHDADHDGFALDLSGVVNECVLTVNDYALQWLEGLAVKQDAAQGDHAGRFAGQGIGELFGAWLRVEKVVFDLFQVSSFRASSWGRRMRGSRL
jgi:hypothetical protein